MYCPLQCSGARVSIFCLALCRALFTYLFISRVLELSDGSSVEEEENGNNSSVMDDELEGDDCEFEGDKGTGVPNSEDVGSDLADFIVDDDDEAEDEEDM